MSTSKDEKTQKPTAKRLRDARKKGQIARSRDLPVAAASLGATVALIAFGLVIVQRLGSAIVVALSNLDRVPDQHLTPEALVPIVLGQAGLLAMLSGPIALSALLAGVSVAFVTQGGFTFATEALKPNWNRLNPATGFSRLAPSQSWLDALKTIAVASVLGWIAWRVGSAFAIESPRLVRMELPEAASRGWAAAQKLLWQAGFALVAFGGIDYGIQRWRLMTSLKMTKQEIREEHKLNEGSPEVKARIRRLQMDMVRQRMLHATARATVVITNPTHYAVALEYRREETVAPVVIAKGRDVLAMRMREIARDKGIPIIENPSLARALYSGTNVGDVIPAELFGAVAEVLAYLVRIKQLMF